MKSKYFNLFTFTLLFALVIIPYFALANDFEVNITPINKNIYPDEYATFTVSVFNGLDRVESFNVYSSPSWLLNLDGALYNIGINETKNATIRLKPKSVVKAGKTYSVPLEIKALLSDLSKNYYVPIYLKSYDVTYGEYVPAISLYANFENDVDPREKFRLQLSLRNRNALNIDNMKIIINGELFYKEIQDSLEPQEEKTLQTSFVLDPMQAAGNHNLNIEIQINNKTYSSLREQYSVMEFANIEVSQEKSREFLRTIYDINVANKGNIKSTKSVELQKNWIERIFLTSNIDYQIGETDGKGVIKWLVELEPNHETNIVVSNNYRLLFVIGLLLLLGTYLYFNLRSEIIVKKDAKVLHTKGIEGVSKLKIKLFIKNRTSKKLHEVEVREKISKLTELIEEKHTLGSPRPSNVIKGKKSTLIKWEFEYLEPYEERIITYKLEYKLKLVGSVQFPRTLVKFKNLDGKLCIAGSNKPTLNLVKKKK